jgi:hypothetical protein
MGKHCWGLPEVPPEENQKCADDNVLLVRLMYLWSLAQQGLGSIAYGFLEHPSDPAWASSHKLAPQAPSIWAMEAVIKWSLQLELVHYHFDQCMFGQVARKATTIASNLNLQDMDNNYCNHRKHHGSSDMNSEALSRYPWKMMQALATAIVEKLVPVIAAQVMDISLPLASLSGDRVPA